MIKNRQNFMRWCVYIFTVLSLAGFLFTPMTGDLKVFFSGANQADFISKNLVVGAYQEWELKGVFSRLLIYAMYKLITLFAPFSSYEFEVAANFIYIILILGVLWVSLRLIFGKTEKQSILLKVALISICFFSTHAGCHMQVEMSCTLLIMLAFSLYVNVIKNENNGKWKLFVAGGLIGATFFFKSVLILLSVSVVAAIGIWMIYNEYEFSVKRLCIVISGSIAVIVVNLGLILLLNPSELQSMVDASAFQSTLFSTNVSVKNVILSFGYNCLKYSWFIPVMPVGILAFVCNLFSEIRCKKWKLILLHIVMWLMPFLFVVLSNKYFVYHFAAFVFPSVIELAELFLRKSKIESMIIQVGILFVVVKYMLYMSVFSTNFREYINMTREVFENRNELFSQLDIDESELFLYLDDGNGSYLVGNESYLKYYYPLPLQRLGEDSTLECYTSSLEKVLNYEGKYISVYEKWFFGEKNSKIKEKIEQEYKYIGSYEIFTPPHSLDAELKTRAYDIYVRK